jgi:uncharacterized coiled-coil DUF342 family protein
MEEHQDFIELQNENEKLRSEINELKEELALLKDESDSYYDILVDIYDRLRREI